jgi:hypothetical protein
MGPGDGSLRGEEVSLVVTPYVDLHADSFFPLAHENPIGGKAPAITLSQLRLLISAVFSIKIFDVPTSLNLSMDADEERPSLSLSRETEKSHFGACTSCIFVGVSPDRFHEKIYYSIGMISSDPFCLFHPMIFYRLKK